MNHQCHNTLRTVCIVLVFFFFIPSLVWALPGDLNESGRVDGFDLIIFSRAFDTQEGDAYWNPLADLNSDQKIDQNDLDILKVYFGQKARSQGCWVADYSNDRVVLLGAESGTEVKQIADLNNPSAVGYDQSNSVTWVVEKGQNAVLRIVYSLNGTAQINTISGFSAPEDLSVNTVDGSCWVADTGNDRIVRLANDTPHNYDLSSNASAYHTIISGFSGPESVSVHSGDGSCWVADTDNHQIVKLDSNVPDAYNISSDFGYHAKATGFSSPCAVAVNSVDGTCWAADPGNDRVVLLAKNGQIPVQSIATFSNPRDVTVNPLENSCWVADSGTDQIVKLTQGGTVEQFRLKGFNNPQSVSVELSSGSCWVADYYNDEVVKVSTNGAEIFRLDGFYQPLDVLSIPEEKPSEFRRPTAVAKLTKLDGLKVKFDGSASLDVDGKIIRYEWDFEGDGSFDYRSADNSTVINTYTQPGIYNPILRVTDNDWLTDLDATKTLQMGTLTVSAEVSPSNGTASDANGYGGTEFNFSGSVIDPSGTGIDNYRWDFNGDGEFDSFSETNPDATHRFANTEIGTHTAVFQVKNKAGKTAQATVTLKVLESHPTASAQADPASGTQPLTTTLSGTGSDQDGSIELYQWDFEGDGVYDWFSLASGMTQNTYFNTGTYVPLFQVTDNKGLTATDNATVQVDPVPPPAPVAVLQASPQLGSAPLQVSFSGASSSVPSGNITTYSWNFGDSSNGSGVQTSHQYTQNGTYAVTLQVTTDQGAQDTDSQTIRVQPPGFPVAAITANPLTGIAPLQVQFDGSQSSDPDGSIQSFAWDFNGFYDDMESNADLWTAESPWARVTTHSHSGSFCWTDSPAGDYEDNVETSLTSTPFALSSNANASLSFWHRHDFSYYATGYLEISTGNDTVWNQLASFSSSLDEWTRETVSLKQYAGLQDLRIRFRLDNTYSYNGDGWYIDDVAISGAVDAVDSTLATPSHTYSQHGQYQPVLKVVDNEGHTSLTSATVLVKSLPQAVIQQPYSSGEYLREDIPFTGFGADPDGQIVLYEWDFNGDGEYDWNSTAQGTTLHSFEKNGTYNATFRVTDNDGLQSVQTRQFQVIYQAPVDVQVAASTLKGNAPLQVAFEGSATDADGHIAGYEWDFDGDGVFDWGRAGPGRLISFSTQYNSHSWAATNLIDDQVATSSSKGWASTYPAAYPQEFIFALAGETLWSGIDRISINPETTEAKDRWAKDFQVLASVSGLAAEDFSPVHEGNFTLANTAGFQDFDFNATSVKYLKLRLLSNYGDTSYVELGEVALFAGHLNVLSPLSGASSQTFSTPGTHEVTFQATDDQGLTAQQMLEIDVLPEDQLQTIADIGPGSTAQETILTGYDLFDDFSNATEYATIWANPSGKGNWQLNNGVLKQTNNDGSDQDDPIYGAYQVAGNETWSDYAVSAQFYSTDNDSMGLMIRYTDQDNYYLFEWNRQNNFRRLMKRTGNGTVELARTTGGYAEQVWYRMSLAAKGSRVVAFINGEPVFDVTDSSHDSGKFGLWCNYNDETHYKDIRVSFNQGNVQTFAWDFDGDGSYETNQTAGGLTTHQYTAPGRQEAVLRVTDLQNRIDTKRGSFQIAPQGIGLSRAWVVDRNQKCIKQLAADGTTVLKEIFGFDQPYYIDVAQDETCWVSDQDRDVVVKLANSVPDGYNIQDDRGAHQIFSGLYSPHDLDVDRQDGSCWVADTYHDRMIKIPNTLSISRNLGYTAAYTTPDAGPDGLTARVFGLQANATQAQINQGVNLLEGPYLSLPASALDGQDDFTFEAWFKHSFENNAPLLSGANGNNDNALTLVLRSDATNVGVYMMGSGEVQYTLPNSIDDGQFHHLALVRQGQNATLYLDGSLVQEKTVGNATLRIDPGGLLIGQEQDVLGGQFDANDRFDGMVDEVRLWGLARSKDQIAANKDAALTGNEAGLTGYWPLDTLSAGGENPVRIAGFDDPVSVTVNPNDSTLWVVDEGYDSIFKVQADVPNGYDINTNATHHLEIKGFYNPTTADVLALDSTCWVLDRHHDQIVQLSSNGSQELARIGGFNDPVWLDVNQQDGSIWVADRDLNDVFHFSRNGTLKLFQGTQFSNPISLAVDSQTGECWVVDSGNDEIRRLAPDGSLLSRNTGYSYPVDIAVMSGEELSSAMNPPDITSTGTDAVTGPAGTSITLSATGTDNTNIIAYEWDFDGDGAFDAASSTGNISHTYTEPGYYLPVLRITDSDGQVDYAQLEPIRIGQFTAEIKADNTSGPAPLGVNFSASAFDPNGRLTLYEWDFDGDGEFEGTGESIDHSYQDHGTFETVLRVSSTSGTAYDLIRITTNQVGPSVSNVKAEPDSGQPPLRVKLSGSGNDQDGSIVLSQWDYNGDGVFDWSSTDTESTFFNYTTAGSYNATFKVTDNDGLNASGSHTILVNTEPAAAFAMNADKGYAPLTVDFDGSASSDGDGDASLASFNWDFGDGQTGNGTKVSHTFQSTGTFTITLTVTDELGATDQASAAIEVLAPGKPMAVIEATPSNGTAPLPVAFSAHNSTDNATIALYEWDFDEGFTLDAQGYPTRQLFLGTWESSGCGDVSSLQDGILSVLPYEGLETNGKTWVSATDQDGNFDWESIFGGSYNTYAYSHIYIYAASEQTARIHFGSDDAARFWINGEKLYSKTDCEGVSIDEYQFDCPLIQGWNTILVSISQGSGGWGLAYRFTDTEDTPLQLPYSLQPQTGIPEFTFSSNSSATAGHTYTQAGTYTPQLTITDQDGNQDSESMTILVSENATKPVASASAAPTAGDDPLLVSLNGTGTDPDGTIVLYEWDFDGDGIFDWNSTQNGLTDYLFEQTGNIHPHFRVTDNDGLTDEASVQITSGGFPPVAVPVAYPLSGPAPLKVKFNTKGQDADNTIADFRWDFDGDGTFDFNSPISMTADHTYTTPGSYEATLKVTDHDGFTHQDSVTIQVTVPEVPEVTAQASPRIGAAPLSVVFSAYSTDLDGTISGYRWDPGDGTGWTSYTASAVFKHTYTQAGHYTAWVETKDNEGNTGTDSVQILVAEAGAPQVQALADTTQGTASLAVTFTAEVTPQAEDPVVSYAWDFDGDGTFDWQSASPEPLANEGIVHVYEEPGTYTALLKVTAQSGLTGFGLLEISVTPGLKIWRGTENFDPTVQQSMPIHLATSNPLANFVLTIVNEQSELIRTLAQAQELKPGTYHYIWDGLTDDGDYAQAGVYYFIAEYDAGGIHYVYDLTNTEGFQRQTPDQQYQSSFDPFSGDPLDVRFDLSKPAEVSIYVFDWGQNLDIRTIHLKSPMTSGNKVVSWDGTNDEGKIIPSTSDQYTISTSAWYLPDNGLILETRPRITNVLTSPQFYNPALNPYVQEEDLTISFHLSKQADVHVMLLNSNSQQVRVIQKTDLPAGPNTLYWDGHNADGELMAPGRYRARVKAKDASGQESMATYSVFNLFY